MLLDIQARPTMMIKSIIKFSSIVLPKRNELRKYEDEYQGLYHELELIHCQVLWLLFDI